MIYVLYKLSGLTSTLGAALSRSRRVRRGAGGGGTREGGARGHAPVTGARVTAPPPRVVMFPHPDLLPRHRTRLGALAGLELGHPGLGGVQPRAELGDQPLQLGHSLLEVPELTTGGTRGPVVRTLQQVAVVTRHQPGVLEITLKVNRDCSNRLITS